MKITNFNDSYANFPISTWVHKNQLRKLCNIYNNNILLDIDSQERIVQNV